MLVIESIPEALDGERIDRVVALITGLSRSAAASAIDGELVTIDGVVVGKSSTRVAVGQEVSVDDSALEVDTGLEPDAEVSVDVVFVDDDVIVVNKAPGQVVHPGAGNPTGTIAQGVLAQYPEVAEVGEPDRPGVVHRLDKGTSGIFMIARSATAYDSLTTQLRERTVYRRYLTVGWGHPQTGAGLIDAPIGRAVRDPTRMVVREDGKPARTEYEVLATWHEPAVSLFACRLETGRTHQIRVHLEAIHHPVVGDRRYGGGRDALAMERPTLHAWELGFEHPTTGEWMEFTAPIPDDIAALFAMLGAPDEGSLP